MLLKNQGFFLFGSRTGSRYQNCRGIIFHLSKFSASWMANRYSLREGDSGKQQHSLRNSSELFKDIIAMPTWIQKNKMLLICKLTYIHSSVFKLDNDHAREKDFILVDLFSQAITVSCRLNYELLCI